MEVDQRLYQSFERCRKSWDIWDIRDIWDDGWDDGLGCWDDGLGCWDDGLGCRDDGLGCWDDGMGCWDGMKGQTLRAEKVARGGNERIFC